MNTKWRYDKGSIDFDGVDLMLIDVIAPTSTVLAEKICEEVTGVNMQCMQG